jgi:serpin B
MKKMMIPILLMGSHVFANDFAFKLYDQMAKQEGNLFFSPASIEAALVMTREGAAGTTRKQFDFLLPPDRAFPEVGTNVTLETANAIWTDQTFPILGTFQKTVTEKYAAEVRAADFAGQPDAERKTINRWVEEKTRDKIRNLLPGGSVTAMTRLILVNAIYFKGDWLHAFQPEKTEDTPFRIAPDKSIPVPMMRLSGTRFRYGENERFQTLELPYEGETVSMRLILPKERDGLSCIEESFAAGNFKTCFDGMSRRDVNVLLPRFKIESTFPSLKASLTALGLTDAFNAQRADFSGISSEQVFISDVIHKAFVEVNEEGTEAAAATGVLMKTTSIGAPPATFRADRPFIFMIRENETGKILFLGRVMNPAQ